MPITDSEKARRRALLFADPQSIRHAHGLMGYSGTDGAFEDIHHFIDCEHFTEDEIIVEGRLCGKHVGEFQGVEATGRSVELPYVAFYHFDETDKLISERVVMNLGVLFATAKNV